LTSDSPPRHRPCPRPAPPAAARRALALQSCKAAGAHGILFIQRNIIYSTEYYLFNGILFIQRNIIYIRVSRFGAQAAAPAAAAATVTAAAAPPPPPGAPPPFVPEADPFLSLSATGTPSAPPVPPSSSRPTPSVAGTPPFLHPKAGARVCTARRGCPAGPACCRPPPGASAAQRLK
jgi:hypothetical protein